jgi:hypothetical protein
MSLSGLACPHLVLTVFCASNKSCAGLPGLSVTLVSLLCSEGAEHMVYGLCQGTQD